MRRHSLPAAPVQAAPSAAPRSEWGALRKLAPYVWQWRWRVLLALGFLVAAKVANVGVPLVLKQLVDALDLKPGDPQALLVVPVALLLAYGALRISVTLFTEMREFLFYPVAARIARRVSLETFDHLLSLSLRFHLERQTGGVSRDIERGSTRDPLAAELHDLQHPADAGRDDAGDRRCCRPSSTAGSRSSRSARWRCTSPSPSR